MCARRINPDADLDDLFGPAWIALQSHYPELPYSIFRPMADELGFAAIEPLPIGRVAVYIGPAMMYFQPDLRFLTLMHEAAHALDYARNGKISGHYENFATIVREMGMTAEIRTEAPRAGDYEPRMTDQVRVSCSDVIALLSDARWIEARDLVQQ